MAIKLKKIPTKIMLWSIGVYLGLLFLITGAFDFASFLAYAVLGFLISELAAVQINKWNSKKIFMLGAIISVLYHVIGIALDEFTVTVIFIAWTAIQQGVVSLIIYKVMGGKK